jgi:2-oxo-4-hydroxy-4-carboxy--5-ureidoimidazoline (OHCU) decarboxylase
MSTPQPSTDENTPLRGLLHTLLEAPPSSLNLLCAQMSAESAESPSAVAEKAVALIHTWQPEDKAAFIHGHPRIGEQSNLSALSAAEQAKYATPPEVLERLKVLNQEYERRFTGLR